MPQTERMMFSKVALPVTVILGATQVDAAVLYVPSKQYRSIQSAINAAVDGDTVQLAPGEFVERCVVQGKRIVIRGSGSSTTTLRPPQGGDCLSIPEGDPSAFELSDVTVTGGSSLYGHAVVSLAGTGPKTVRRCVFVENPGWAALNVFGDGSAVEDCAFDRNGLGASIAFGQGIVLRRCKFSDNHQLNSAGGGPWVPSDIDAYSCSFSASDCDFVRGISIGGAPVRVVAVGQFTRCRFSALQGGTASVFQSYNSDAVARFEYCDFCACPEPRFAGSGQFIDAGGNSVSTTCIAPCPTDLVHDGATNGADMAVLLNFWGTNGSQYPGVDLNNDGIVNGTDLAMLLNAWGPCPQ